MYRPSRLIRLQRSQTWEVDRRACENRRAIELSPVQYHERVIGYANVSPCAELILDVLENGVRHYMPVQ